MMTMTDVAGLRRIEAGPSTSTASATNAFISTSLPLHMGNRNRIAYGGCALALCVHAAYQTVAPESLARLRIYSVLGTYLGPTSLDAHVELEVMSLRDTKSFATRAITASQTLITKDPKTGQERQTTRKCMFVVVDFIASLGTSTLLQYSVQPLELQAGRSISDYEAIPPREEALRTALAQGELTEAQMAGFQYAFKASSDLAEQRVCREGVFGQNLNGILTQKKTTQDDRLVTDKTSYDWYKSRIPLRHAQGAQTTDLLLPPTQQAASAVFLSFMMDGALSFMPLSHSHLFVQDAQACSSLDLALRFHVDEFDANEWHLREIFTVMSEDERTYSESRLFRKTSQGNDASKGDPFKLVATMTQACILRAKAGAGQPRL